LTRGRFPELALRGRAELRKPALDDVDRKAEPQSRLVGGRQQCFPKDGETTLRQTSGIFLIAHVQFHATLQIRGVEQLAHVADLVEAGFEEETAEVDQRIPFVAGVVGGKLAPFLQALSARPLQCGANTP
jgi:hypothetical protein